MFCNRAACHLKLSNLDSCIADATSAVESDRKAAKALFRRAQAYEKLGKVEDACRDLYALMRQDAATKQAKKAYARVKKMVRGCFALPHRWGKDVYLKWRFRLPGTLAIFESHR